MMSKPQFFVSPGYGQLFLDELYFSQAVRIGDRVEISGQGGWNDDLKIPTDIEAEISQAFLNVERALSLAGANWTHVFHVNSYHVGGFPPIVNATMSRLFRQYMPDNAPIWTQLGVEALGLPEMRIEIRVIAHVSPA
jgi:enamine deaminase RidA (YjgF/YER057c/UK114 family)